VRIKYLLTSFIVITGLSIHDVNESIGSQPEIVGGGLVRLGDVKEVPGMNEFSDFGAICDNFGKCLKNAKTSGTMHIMAPQLTAQAAEQIKQAGYVTHLSVIDATNATVEQISKLPSLKVLVMQSSQVSDLGLSRLSSPNLRALDVEFSHDMEGEGFKNANLPSLEYLSLGVAISDSNLLHLKKFKLKGLYMKGAKITGSGLQHVPQSLKYLDLNGSLVNDAGLANLAKQTGLEYLNLGYTENITDSGVAHLIGLENLTYLELGGFGSKVTDAGEEKLRAALPKTEIFVWPS